MLHFASGTNTESCTLSLTGSSILPLAGVEADRFDVRLELRAGSRCARPNRSAPTLKLVGRLTCSTLTFSSGGRNACGSGLHSVISFGSKLSHTVGSV